MFLYKNDKEQLWYVYKWTETNKWDAEPLSMKTEYENKRHTRWKKYQYDYEPNRPHKISPFISESYVVKAKTKEEALCQKLN